QQVLKDNRRPLCGDAKTAEPTFAQWFTTAKAVERLEITTRKRHIKLFHPQPVFKQARRDACFDLKRDISIERGEIAQTIACIAGAKNDLIKLQQNFIDGLW